jgi:hypothetical protein
MIKAEIRTALIPLQKGGRGSNSFDYLARTRRIWKFLRKVCFFGGCPVSGVRVHSPCLLPRRWWGAPPPLVADVACHHKLICLQAAASCISGELVLCIFGPFFCAPTCSGIFATLEEARAASRALNSPHSAHTPLALEEVVSAFKCDNYRDH